MITNDFYGSNTQWFIGVVKDGEQDGARVRVRIMGIHPFENNDSGSGPAYQAVSNGDLPWAAVVFPVDSENTDHNLQEEDWVYGFFADPGSYQQPVVIGKIGRAESQGNNDFLGPEKDSTGNIKDLGGKDVASVPTGKDIGKNLGPTSKVNKNMYYGYVPGNSNQEKAFNFFTTYFHKEHGVPLEKAKQISAGVVASLTGESGMSLNPYAIGDGGTSEGIAQWHKNRRRAMRSMCHRGDFVCQLNYAVSELKPRGFGHGFEGKESTTLRKLLNARDPRDAAVKWTVYYERPANPRGESRKRASRAYAIYKKFKDSYQPATRGVAVASGK